MNLFTTRRLIAGLCLSAVFLSGCASKPAPTSEEETGGNGASTSAPVQTEEIQPDQSAPDQAPEAAPSPEELRQPETSAGGETEAPPRSAPEDAGESPDLEEESQAVSGSAALSEYDFSQPCPESPAVDNSYFEDAAFVGDSRTEGFMIYSGIGCGEKLTSNGLSIFKLAEKKALTIDGTKYTLLEALALKEYGKVYLSLGVNELGYHNDQGFYDAYCQAIDAIRACQPNAVIYIQGLIPLNEDVIAATGGADYLTNEHLLVYNDLMKQAAQEKQVVFLDLNPVFTGPDGQLPAEASTDGVHLRKSYCEQWLEYLKTHTVDFDTLYSTQEAQA